jgi:erythromycin esterase
VAAGPQAQPPSQEELAKLGAVLQRGGERLQRSEAGGLGERELLLARQYVHVALQLVDRQRDPEAQARFAVRDRAMADNLLWIANVAEPGTRIVLWAHNGHVGNAETFIPWMGRHLESALGADYLPIGFLFHHGAFQAMDRSGEKTALRELSLGQPPAGTLEDTFERAGWPVCALDLRRLPAGPVADWFGRSQRMRETGSVFSSEENMLVTRVLPGDFEAVIFVESTTRARPNPPLAER